MLKIVKNRGFQESKIHHARVVRPVTWYGHENNSPDEDDDVHEAEQVRKILYRVCYEKFC